MVQKLRKYSNVNEYNFGKLRKIPPTCSLSDNVIKLIGWIYIYVEICTTIFSIYHHFLYYVYVITWLYVYYQSLKTQNPPPHRYRPFSHFSNHQKWLPYKIKRPSLSTTTEIWSTKLNVTLWVSDWVNDIYLIIEKLSFKNKCTKFNG